MGLLEEFIVHPEIKKKLEGLVEEMGVTNYTLNIDQGATKGDNYLGVIAKVTVEGVCSKSGLDVIFQWIIKSAPQIETYRKFLNLQKVYGREIYVYEKIFPLFQKYQLDNDVLSPFTSIAPFLMSCLDEFQECLVMADMKALGYQMKDRKLPLDFNHVRLVMRAYGKFHALSYALKEQKPEMMQNVMGELEDNFFRLISKEQNLTHAKLVCEKALKSLDPVNDKHYIELFNKYSETCADLLLETIDLAHKDPHAIIVHGDSWVNNMLFRYGDSKKPTCPTEVCLLDFQLAMYGSPAFDLSYFIFTCTDKTLRDERYDQMIRIYYATLCSHLADLGSDPQKVIPFHVLEAQLKRYSIYGLYMSTMVLHLMISDTEEIPDLTKPMTDEEMTQSFFYVSKNVNIYNERVRGVIVDFVEKEYLDFLKN